MHMWAGLLAATFLVSCGALFLFIWSMSRGLFGPGEAASRVIFGSREVGLTEEPAASSTRQQDDLQEAMNRTGHTGEFSILTPEEADERAAQDASGRLPVLLSIGFAALWLVVASIFGLMASIKLHAPDWLVGEAWLTFGRIRPAHLNAVAYGWCSLAAFGVALWLMPRLLRTPLVGTRTAAAGATLWGLGVTAGMVAVLTGNSTGLEWLEFPWYCDVPLVIGGTLMGVALLRTLRRRTVDHLYVSVWYIAAGLVWLPILITVANWPGLHHGVQQAAMNWWYGHNVLGLWFTPIGLAAIYYFIPKVLGKPIHSYNLSLVGFWSLAFFYSQVGGHHLIGGPVPGWIVSLSIVQSMMMVIPVLAVAINQHRTSFKHLGALRHSPTLRFVVLGGMMYTLASIQGSIESLRFVNTITHFTHYTVAHAHLGLYGFFSMVMFGAIYFILPRVLDWEWPSAGLIRAHFWLVMAGFTIYFVGLSTGGWLQGLAMLDAARPFMDSVTITKPYLLVRTIGGTLMTVGHLVFALHVGLMLARRGEARRGPTLLRRLTPSMTPAVTVANARAGA
jgi:cytochrome c oxidase cbb3-type subunit 1